MRTKIKLLFKLERGVEAGSLRGPIEFEIARLDADLSAPSSIFVGKSVEDPALHVIAAGAFDPSEGPFDVMIEIVPPEGEIDRASALLTGLGERLKGIVDGEASAALIGTEHVVLAGEGKTFVLIANRRLPHLDHEQFLDYWAGFHAAFTRTHTPPEIGMRYRQFHTDEARTRILSAGTGLKLCDFDGAAECFYPNEAALRDLMALTEIVDEATEDEVKFVDHERCVTTVFEPSPDLAIL